MLPVLIGLIAAMIFSIVTYMIYGLKGIMMRDWIDQVFWAMIFSGLAIGFITSVGRCLPCRLSKLIHREKLISTFCNSCIH